MKKLMFMAALAVFSLGASAGDSVSVTTSCGKQTTTIGPSAFNSNEEFKAYLHEVNFALCQEDGNVTYQQTV